MMMMILGATTILSLAAMGITIREGLPRVPYATALDVFHNLCMVYLMAALIEYAAVNYFTKLMPKEGGLEDDEDEEEEKAEEVSCIQSVKVTSSLIQIAFGACVVIM